MKAILKLKDGNGKEKTVYVYGGWYVVRGGRTVNRTCTDWGQVGSIEEIKDEDCFTWDKGIKSLNELIKAVKA